jgi:hypothetical protein
MSFGTAQKVLHEELSVYTLPQAQVLGSLTGFRRLVLHDVKSPAEEVLILLHSHDIATKEQ